jgi:DNA-binding MltR family transcriptional regulator
MAKPIKIGELSGDSQHLYDVLNGESDMSMVIVAVAYLDVALRSLLYQVLNTQGAQGVAERLLSGPVLQFGARTDLARCLRLLSERTHSDLQRLRRIRNEFAHVHTALSFRSPAVMEWCRQLQSWKLIEMREQPVANSELSSEQCSLVARNQFKLSAILTLNRLVVDAMSIEIDPTYRAGL